MIQLNTQSPAYEMLWLDAFLKTQIIELSLGLTLSIGYILLHSSKSEEAELSHRLALPPSNLSPYYLKFSYLVLAFITATTITHPFLWFVLPQYIQIWDLSYYSYVMIGELIVWQIEALWYYFVIEALHKRYSLALALSLFLNGASYLIGVYW